jgi:TrmH family RNA methyltransferase
MKMITSVHNPKIQDVRRLLSQSKERRLRGECVVEGVRLAEEALGSGWEACLVLFNDRLDPRGQAIVDAFSSRGVAVEAVSDHVMESLSATETPQGVMVVLNSRPLPIPASLDFLLVLDGVRDPGNLGTILRTAAAAGVEAVFLSTDCVDELSPKVLRAGMGAHFHLPLLRLEWPELTSRLTSFPSLHVYLADSSSGIAYTQVDFRSPLALIVGGEAAGAGNQAVSLAEREIHIPMPGGSESLNVAIASSILLFEVVRQRASEIT